MSYRRKSFIVAALALVCVLVIGASPTTFAQSSVVFFESFDDSSMFTTSTAFFSDGGGDYFGVSDGAGAGDFGGGATPSALKAYAGFTGGFLTGMDLDGEGATLPITVNWTSISINDVTDLQFSGDFAEYFDDPGDIDDLDYIRIEYQIDGGGYQNLIWFSGADFTSTGGPFNGIFREDTDFDGVGDGALLGNAAQTFTSSIAGTGSTLDLRMSVSLNSGDEDFAVDNFVINGEGGGPPVEPGQALPLAENFDDCTLEGWEIISVDADTANTWSCSEQFSNIDVNGFGDNAPANEWLITPPLNLNAQENDTLTFRSYTNFSDIDYPQLSVLYSTDYDGNGDPTSAAWTELNGITFSPEDSGVWTDSGNVDLSGISGTNVYIAFQYTSSGNGGGSAANWRLDAINIFEGSSATAYKIHEIQGSGLVSPLVGEEVIIEGVVVGDFQAQNQFNGFHVQEEDSDVDDDPTTSEGIFIFYSSTDVSVGEVVRVIGMVAEFNDLTEITNVESVEILGSGASVAETAVSLPVASVEDFEAFEGMLVTFPQELTISEYFNFDRYGEVVLSIGRQFQPTAVYEPSSPEAAALAAANQLSRIMLDDGSGFQNPDPARHPNGAVFDLTNTFRGGDTVQNVTGIMDYARGTYRVQPTTSADYVAQNPRTTAPDVGGPVKVASFNVLNYFTTFGSRGADDALEFERQRTKIFAALADIDADVVGLIEIENNNDVAVIDLVTGLNELVGAGTYDYIATGTIGGDEITTAFIYKPATLAPVGSFAVLDDVSFTDPNNTGQEKNRPALAQTFMEIETDSVFTVVVNHLKSKGSGCGEGDDDPEQGSCNLTRTLAAQALVDWLATDPTANGDADYLIIGDLNAYDKEDPIDAFLVGADDTAGTADDFTDLSYLYSGEFAYSYVFSGQFGYLDYALANASLLPQITGVSTWNVNADEPDILDYDMTFKQDAQDALYEPNAYRSSDHDPVIVGLDFGLPRNSDGCFVIAAENTVFEGRALTVDTRYRVLNGIVWLLQEDLSPMSCLEIHGTNGRDTLIGSRGDDSLFGYDGRDVLFGYRGDDTFTGGLGRDFFNGHRGQDTVLDYERFEQCISIEEGCPSSRH